MSREEEELLDALVEMVPDVSREDIKKVLTGYAWLRISQALDDVK